MRFGKIRELVRIVEESNIRELEVGGFGEKVRIIKDYGGSDSNYSEPVLEKSVPVVEEKKEEEGFYFVKSPMVGTFYLEDGGELISSPGQKVKKGEPLCYIEAMKLRNDLNSDFEGRIEEICVENEHPVEFGQKLFKIRPDKA